jgi:hypothetical protein
MVLLRGHAPGSHTPVTVTRLQGSQLQLLPQQQQPTAATAAPSLLLLCCHCCCGCSGQVFLQRPDARVLPHVAQGRHKRVIVTALCCRHRVGGCCAVVVAVVIKLLGRCSVPVLVLATHLDGFAGFKPVLLSHLSIASNTCLTFA